MGREGSGWAVLIVIGIAIAFAFAANASMFYTTGSQWFDSCWTAQHAQRKAKSADEAVSWGQCEKTASTAIFDAGFMFGIDRTEAITQPARAVAGACPSSLSDLPIGGVAVLGVGLVSDNGGPSFIDRFTPAGSLIVRAFRQRWPSCPSVRMANHFPKLVERPSGQFDWEHPCEPCQVEGRARAARPQLNTAY